MGKLFLVFFLLTTLMACSPKLNKNVTDIREENPSYFLEKAAYLPDWMEGRCQLQMESEGMNLSGQAIIRVRKDSAVWVSLRKLGFEVGRALILKDSFYYLDRLSNNFQSFPLSYLQDKYQIPGDFFYLQALLFGNAPLEKYSQFKLIKKETLTWQIQNLTSEGIISLEWDFANKRISSINWNQPFGNKYFIMKLSDYKALESQQHFSYFRDLNIKSAETGNLHVTLSFNQVQFNLPVSLRFDIPQRYSGSN
jgi:Domain of unknown function (DUF4292)